MLKEYCPVCGKEVRIEIKKKLIHFEEKDVKFDYYEKVAVCTECEEELYSDSLQNENQKAFDNAFMKATNSITKVEILEILKKYSISKRNLPIVLELGELTITRYLDGEYIPTKKISDLLKAVSNDASLYKEYLDRNKDKLTHNVFVKTNNKVESILKLGKTDEKLEAAAEYVIREAEVSNLVLNKILYYFDVYCRIFFDKKIFDSQVGAWDHGPVYGRIYYEYKNFGREPIILEDLDTLDININNIFSKEEKELLNKVTNCFGAYSGKVLSYFTHHDGPWKENRDNNNDFIDSIDLDEYAKIIKEKYQMKKFDDIEKYCDDMFARYKKDILKLQS